MKLRATYFPEYFWARKCNKSKIIQLSYIAQYKINRVFLFRILHFAENFYYFQI